MNPIDNSSTAAFACSVLNQFNFGLTIQWMFSDVNSTDFSAVTDVMGDQVTILDDLPDSGTSILILESVSEINEGRYFCRVEFCCGSLNSTGAVLTFNGR